jgi:hypothetical protein
MRDDFLHSTKEILARRVNYLCSNPDCGRLTVGPHTDDAKFVNKGVAAHVTAASVGGKRYDDALTAEARMSVANGIWLCQNCAKLIDSDESRYSVALLREWKSRAEASVQESVESNLPIQQGRNSADLRVRASYAGGRDGSRVNIQLFNAGSTPIYIAAWCASWGNEARSATQSVRCIRGRLPSRLDGQDQLDLVVDVGSHPVAELQAVGVVDGVGRRWNATDVQVATIVQQSQKYAPLRPERNTAEIEERLKQCDIEIRSKLFTEANGHKRLLVTFTNKSVIPIQLHSAEIKWTYDPPRLMPAAPDSKLKVSEAGGSVQLTCDSNLKLPIAPGNSAEFYLTDELAGVLVETILGDVKDQDIQVAVYTNTRVFWKATEDEIPETVRKIARYAVEKAQ